MRVSPDWETFEKLFNRNFPPHMPEQSSMSDKWGKKDEEAAN
jgi:hypothetical protein